MSTSPLPAAPSSEEPPFPGGSDGRGRTPRTHLGWGLAASVLCFLPLGLIALYFGIRTSRAVVEGRDEDAARDSRTARRWIVATVVVGGLLWVVIGAALALLGAFSS